MKKFATVLCCLALAVTGWFLGNINKSPGLQQINAATPVFSYDLLLSQMEQRAKSCVQKDTVFIHDTLEVKKIVYKQKEVRGPRPETSGITSLSIRVSDLLNEVVREEQTKDTIEYIHNANGTIDTENDNHSVWECPLCHSAAGTRVSP